MQGFGVVSGSVGNAERIWVSTPQNHTYQTWELRWDLRGF